MTDRFDQFEQSAVRAAADAPPSLDVTQVVTRRIQSIHPVADDVNRTLAVCGSLATVAAMVALATATWAWYSWSDPVVQVFSQAHLVMQ
ncbi:MAG: hypothetical protein MI757_13220 [Pirellulales bacterium]|nr:hypothetical protein [Pirellulales bacterium]